MPDIEVQEVEYHRDTAGTLFAVELIEAPLWHAEYLDPPDPRVADARIVRLRGGTPPAELPDAPDWLHIERAVRGVRDLEAGYTVDGAPVAGAVQRRLWLASPYWRSGRPALRAYLDAAEAAMNAPATVTTGRRRPDSAMAAELRRFARARRETEPWSVLAMADEPLAFERWVQVSFASPEALADEILLERLAADGQSEAVALVRYLRGARIVEDTPERLELAVDRRALLEQATPWRHYQRGDLDAAFPAVRAWMARYRADYERWYRVAVERLEPVRDALAAAAPQHAMLTRLDRIGALGAPSGETARAAVDGVLAAIAALPATADLETPTTADLALGGAFALEAEASGALSALGAASERRQRRLAGALASIIMGRHDVEPIDRVLQALLAADLDDLDRVLNENVMAQIESLLGPAGGRSSPLSELLARFDEVSADTVDDVVVAFRVILEEATLDGGRVALR